jgi:hypothetical protein
VINTRSDGTPRLDVEGLPELRAAIAEVLKRSTTDDI